METAIIHIERTSAWADFLRAYKVVLDGEPVGTIRQGKSRSFEVKPGHHEIFLTVDWCSSQPIFVNLAPSARVHLICQGREVFSALSNTLFGANDYIKLYQEPFKLDYTK